ncbi:MAG: MFS transporter [Acidobacteriia bacterium]|nr:MFS transporter [Terriglobia bacterium]
MSLVLFSCLVIAQHTPALTFGGIALFLPLIRADLQMNFAQAGMLSAASTLTYALGQIPAGFLSDRFGPKRLFFIGILGSTLLSLNFGLIHTFQFAVINQLVTGVFRALMFAPGLALLASWFPPERRATAMGLYVVGGFSGNIFLSLVGPLLVNQYGWRFTIVFFSIAGIGAALLYLAFGKEKPREGSRQRVGMLDAFRLFKYEIMWVCGAIQFIRLGVVVGINFWLPSLLVADRGLSIQEAGFVVAMGAAFTVLSNVMGGYVSDRLRNPPLVIGGSLAVIACTSTLLVLVHSIPLLLVVIAINSMFLQFYFGALFFVPVEVLGLRIAGMSTGFSNLFANIGALTFAYALGVVKDRAGTFTWGFVGISVACVVGIMLAFVLARIRNRALAAQQQRMT